MATQNACNSCADCPTLTETEKPQKTKNESMSFKDLVEWDYKLNTLMDEEQSPMFC